MHKYIPPFLHLTGAYPLYHYHKEELSKIIEVKI